MIPGRRLGAATAAALAAALAAAALLVGCGGGERNLTVFAAASLRDVFREAAAAFEAQQVDVNIRLNFGGSQRLRVQIEQGARVDVFAAADRTEMAKAEEAGLIGAEPVPFAANVLVLVVPASNPAGITSLADLAERRVRLVVAGPDVPAGRLTLAELERLGLAEAVLASVVSEEDNVRAVLTKVAVGEADAGFVYSTDAASAGADVLVFPVGADSLRNEYLIARTIRADEVTLADAFVAFVRAEAVGVLLQRAGFLPLGVVEAEP